MGDRKSDNISLCVRETIFVNYLQLFYFAIVATGDSMDDILKHIFGGELSGKLDLSLFFP